MIGNDRLDVFPVWEMSFAKMPENRWHIATERVKWSTQYQKRHGIMTDAAKLDEAVVERIQRIAKRAYRALDLNGYARIDVRLDEQRQPFVLEANPNPEPRLRRGLCRIGRDERDLLRGTARTHPRAGPAVGSPNGRGKILQGSRLKAQGLKGSIRTRRHCEPWTLSLEP